MTRSTLRNARTALATLAAIGAFAAGTLTSPAALATTFDNRMSEMVAHVKADPTYKRIPLDTIADKQWFYDKTEALYEKKISKEQYVAEGSQRFPGYEASFTEVAEFIQQPK